MQKYRFSIVVALLIVAVIAAWYFYYQLQTQPSADTTLREQFSWQLVEIPATATAGLHTSVSLKIADVSVPVGTYAGTCDNPLSYLPGEITGVVCTGGENGTEIGVFRENGKLVLQEGAIDSATGRGADFAPVKKQ